MSPSRAAISRFSLPITGGGNELLVLIFVQLSMFGSLSARAEEQTPGSDLERLCPEAAREHERLLLTHPAPQDVRNVTRPALRRDLLQMVDEDQNARQRLVSAMRNGEELPGSDPRRNYARAVDSNNLRRLKHIITQDGLPTTKMVGVNGVQAAFVLVAHAETDLQFQKRMLKAFSERLRDGELKGGQFALLTDKVLRAQGKPQKYGTQFDDQLRPEPIADPSRVDERRHALGMISMANYTCEIHAMYGETLMPR